MFASDGRLLSVHSPQSDAFGSVMSVRLSRSHFGTKRAMNSCEGVTALSATDLIRMSLSDQIRNHSHCWHSWLVTTDCQRLSKTFQICSFETRFDYIRGLRFECQESVDLAVISPDIMDSRLHFHCSLLVHCFYVWPPLPSLSSTASPSMIVVNES